MRAGTPGTPEVQVYLKDTLPPKSKVGIDPQVHSAASARALKAALEEGGHALVSLRENPVDAVWGSGRPAPPAKPMRVHPAQWAGEGVRQKLDRVRQDMARAGAQVLVVAMLDEVCWLLNVRGGDVDFNPVTVAYTLVHPDAATLYVDAGKVVPEVAAQLAEAGVAVKPYGAVWGDIAAAAKAGKAVWADPAKVSLAIFDAVEEGRADGAAASRAKARRRGSPGKEKEESAPAAASSAAAKNGVVESASPIALAKARLPVARGPLAPFLPAAQPHAFGLPPGESSEKL